MTRTYLKPNWVQRNIANRLTPRFVPKIVRLTVPGRRSGRPHTTPVTPIEHDGKTYLVAAFGVTDWALNLRSAGRCTVRSKAGTTTYHSTEVPVDERPPILAAYLAVYGKYPNVTPTFDRLQDPADHPTFLLTPA